MASQTMKSPNPVWKNDVIRVCFEKESPNLLTYHIRAISVRDLYFFIAVPYAQRSVLGIYVKIKVI